MKLFKPDGSMVDVPDDQAQAALSSGQYGAPADAQIPVVVDGKVGTVPFGQGGSNFQEAIAAGATMTTLDAYARAARSAQLEEEYGGVGGTLAAAGLGFADTATFGIAPAVAGAVGGPGAQKYMREVEEAHPTATTIGQVGGVVAPIIADIATAGAATPLVAGSVARVGARAAEGTSLALRGAEAAEVATAAARAAEPGLLSRGAAALAAPQRALSEVGNVAERTVQAVVGKEAEGLAGKFVQRTAALAGRGATEGAAIAGLENVKEQVLSEAPGISGEKLLTAVGHGAMFGGALGGGLGALSAGAAGAARAAEPVLQKGSDSLFGKAVGLTGEHLTAAEALPGGVRALREKLIRTGVMESGDRIDQVAEKVAAARVAAEKELNAQYAGLDAVASAVGDISGVKYRAGPLLSDVEKALDEAVPRGSKKFPGAPEGADVTALKDYLRKTSNVEETLQPAAAETVTRRVERTPEAVADYVKKNIADPEVQAFVNGKNRKPSFLYDEVRTKEPMKAGSPRPDEGRLTFAQAADFSDRLHEAAHAATGKAGEELRRAADSVSNVLEKEALQRQGRQAAGVGKIHEEFGTLSAREKPISQAEVMAKADEVLGGRMLSARQLRLADDSVRAAVSRAAKKEVPTSIGQLLGGSLGLGAGTVGLMELGAKAIGKGSGVGLAAGAVGLGYKAARKLAEERGASFGAVQLDKLASVGAVENALARVNREMDRRVDKAFEGRVVQKAESIAADRAARAERTAVEKEAGRLEKGNLREADFQVAKAQRELDDTKARLDRLGESVEGRDMGEVARLSAEHDRLTKEVSEWTSVRKNIVDSVASSRAGAAKNVAEAASKLYTVDRDEVLGWAAKMATERHLQDVAARLAQVPATANAFQQTAIRVITELVQTMPKPPPDPSSLNPYDDRWRPSEGDMAVWLRRKAIATDPLSYGNRVADGTITPQEISTMEKTHPAMKADYDAKFAARYAAAFGGGAPGGGGEHEGKGKGKKAHRPTLAAESAIKMAMHLPRVNPSVTRVVNAGYKQPGLSSMGKPLHGEGNQPVAIKGDFGQSHALKGREE